MKRAFRATTLAAACLALAIPARAVEPADGHGSHPHHVSLLLGAAQNGAIDETAFAAGVGYRYALNDRFSIGPSVDFASYDHEETMLVLAGLYWKPAGGLVLMAGPGVELVDYEESEHGSAHAAHAAAASSEGGAEDESKFAFRVGAGWELHAGRVSILPFAAADLIDGETTMVLAVDVGFGF